MTATRHLSQSDRQESWLLCGSRAPEPTAAGGEACPCLTVPAPRHTRKRTPRWSSSPGLVPSSKWPRPAAESRREGGCRLRCLLLTGQSAKCPPRAPRRLHRRRDKRTCSCVPRVCRSAGSRGASAAGLALGAVHERRRWQKSRRCLSPVKLLAVLEERPARRGRVLTRPLPPATPPAPRALGGSPGKAVL